MRRTVWAAAAACKPVRASSAGATTWPWHAQGAGIPSKYIGSSNNPTIGATQAQLSGEIQELGVEFATDELHHVIFLRTALGSAAPDKPAVRRAPRSPA